MMKKRKIKKRIRRARRKIEKEIKE